MSETHRQRCGAVGLVVLLATVAAPAALGASTGSDWNITDTGQPYTDARFTVTEGTWMSVDVSPDGKTLVFDLLGDIYSLPAGGGNATLLHGGAAMEFEPRFSPDGSKILYISDRSGSYNLWISNADGSGAWQVSHETLAVLNAPAWDTTGKYVTAVKHYAQTAKMVGTEIWLYHVDGGNGRLMVEMPKTGKAVHEPQFSHDGRYLYYTENVSAAAFINVNQPIYAIKRRDLGDGKVDEVVNGFGGATTGQLSPDDKRLAFIRRVKEKTVLFVYDLQTGQQRPVYDGLERDLRANWGPRSGSYYPQFDWFPDGRTLAIWNKGKLYRIDVDSGARQEIPFRANAEHRITIPPRFENPLAPESFTVRIIQHLAPAPDGKSVTFNALGHLWQKSLPDGKPQRLTKTSAFEFEPSYSRDSAALAYVSWDDEKGSALEVMSSKGRQIKTVLKTPGILRQPSFSPDGKRLVYRLEQGNKKLGGFRATHAGLYWLSLADGQPHFLTPSGHNPQFSPDGTRIYYVVGGVALSEVAVSLESVDLDGLDKRQHVTSEETRDFRVSPDLKWFAYQKDQQYYVIPYRETGAPIWLTKAVDELPATQLTEYGGFEIAWSPNSNRLNWVLGQSFFSAPIDGRAAANVKPTITETDIGLEVPVDKPQGTVAFINGRIITMKGEEVIDRGTIVVKDNRIVALGAAGQVEVPKGAKVIDVAGKTLMPGLVDMHGHFDLDLELTPQKHASNYAALAFGVTTDFDPSAPPELPNIANAELALAGVAVAPRLITTGRVVYGMDGFGMLNPIANYEDARKIIARRKALGTIVLKSYMQPMRSQRQQIIKAAREARLMVTPEGEGQFFTNLTMILDGHMSIEHNMPLPNYYDDLIQLIVHGGTSVTPTIIVTNGETFAENYFYQTTRPWDDPKIKTYVQTTFSWYSPLGGAGDAPPYARGMVTLHQADELWDVGFRSVARTMKKLDAAGGTVTTGAHGQIKGLDMHWEMWALGEGGMSTHRILRAATLNGAKTIGLDKQIGTLEAGKLADLIVLDANPLENIRNTNTVRYTMVNGRLYDSLSMNEIGNYDRPRTRFYWELEDYKGIDWNEAWGGAGIHSQGPGTPAANDGGADMDH